MLGKVILPPLISGEGESTWRMIVSGNRSGATDCSGVGDLGTSGFDDAMASKTEAQFKLNDKPP
jgi:hypothetical protein